jgi:hypothetical protein
MMRDGAARVERDLRARWADSRAQQARREVALHLRLAVWLLLALSGTAQAAREFAHPDRIRYDGECLTIDGTDRLIFSADFEVTAAAEPQWPARLGELKAAGFNAVTIRVPAGELAPEAAARLRKGLHAAHAQFGFYSLVVPGADNAAAVCAAAAAEQVTRRAPGTGGVILCELPAGGDRRARFAAMLAAGIEVPVFTCDSPQCRDSDDPLLRQVFDGLGPVTGADRLRLAANLEALESAQPDAPALWALPAMGGAAVDPAAVVDALEAGATIISCSWSAAALEWARPMALALAKRGGELARAKPLPAQAQAGSPEIMIGLRRTRGGATYIFATNHSAELPLRGRAALWLSHDGVEMGLDYRLPPLGGKLLRLPPGATETAQGEAVISSAGSR